jgi:hypothetical protein
VDCSYNIAVRAALLVVLLALGCKRVERYPPMPDEDRPPSPAIIALSGGGGGPVEQAPAGPAPAPARAPAPSGELPPLPPVPPGSAGDCVVDKIAATLALTADGRSDCTPGDDACKRECDGGNAAACYGRAAAVQNDPARNAEAGTLFGRACQLGHAMACTNYAAGLWLRDGATPENAICARKIFDKACAIKEPFACGMVGRMAVAAAKNDADRAAARVYFEKTCEAIGGPPCKMLASYLRTNQLGAFDPAILPALLQRACDGGDSSACEDLRSQ